MDKATKYLGEYIDEKCISLKRLSGKINISYTILYNSFKRNNRPLRADELLILCDFLEIDPNVIKKKVIEER